MRTGNHHFFCSSEFLFIPDVPGEKHIPRLVPAASETTSPSTSGLHTIAVYDRIRSRRRSSGLFRPGSAFFRIMTSKIRGAGEMRYNRAHSRLRCTRIPAGVFWRWKPLHLTITSGRVSSLLKNRIFTGQFFHQSSVMQGIFDHSIPAFFNDRSAIISG